MPCLTFVRINALPRVPALTSLCMACPLQVQLQAGKRLEVLFFSFDCKRELTLGNITCLLFLYMETQTQREWQCLMSGLLNNRDAMRGSIGGGCWVVSVGTFPSVTVGLRRNELTDLLLKMNT